MSGDPPFEYEDFKQLKAKILTGVSAESLPDACKKSEPCRNLVVDPSLSRCLVLMFLFILTPAAPSSWRKLALDYQTAKLPPIYCIGVSFEPIQHFWRKKAGAFLMLQRSAQRARSEPSELPKVVRTPSVFNS